MLIIKGILVDEKIFHVKFDCSVAECLGACCVRGDRGARVTPAEVEAIESDRTYMEYLDPARRRKIEKEGFLENVREGTRHTLLMEDSSCVFCVFSENGQVLCSLEKAWEAGGRRGKARKPASCLLFPVLLRQLGVFDALLLSFRTECIKAFTGKKSLISFVRDGLIATMGENFFLEMERIARRLSDTK